MECMNADENALYRQNLTCVALGASWAAIWKSREPC